MLEKLIEQMPAIEDVDKTIANLRLEREQESLQNVSKLLKYSKAFKTFLKCQSYWLKLTHSCTPDRVFLDNIILLSFK